MDAHLDTLSTELYQVNVRVGHIARRQAIMGGFAPEASPPPLPPMASDSDSEDEDKDDDDGDDLCFAPTLSLQLYHSLVLDFCCLFLSILL